MSRHTIAPVAAVLGLALLAGGCARDEAPSASTASAARNAEPAEGAPRIVTSADGVHITYHVYGKGEPAVVLVHGWSCDSSYWREQIEALDRKYTVVTLDLAGHGASGRNRQSWSMGSFGEDVAAVARQIPNRRIVLVGHSMGGPVVLEAARRIGDRVVGIVGIDTFKTIGLPPPPKEQLEKLIQPFRADFIGHTRSFVTEYFFHNDADPLLVRKIADDMSLAPPEVAVPAIESLFEMDFAAVLPDIRVPIVAINSDIGAPTDEARIRKTAPTFHAVVLQGLGHFPMMEDPPRFNSTLVREIDSLTAADSAAGPADAAS